MDGGEPRSVQLMNAFGDRARHTVVSALPDQLSARNAIDKHVKYEIALDPPPLVGKPSVKRYEAIARFMRRFDLVLTHGWGAIDGVMAARVFGKGLPPIVHHEDELDGGDTGKQSTMRNMYRRLALPAANALIVPSARIEQAALQFWKQPAERIVRIPRGVPVARYVQAPEPSLLPMLSKRRKGEIFIACISGLQPVEDLPLLVRAVGGMTSRFRLVIIGQGPERQAILDQAEAMAVEDQVFLPGVLPDPHRYLGLFDLFALSAKAVEAPVSVLQAMAAGLTVVAPRLGDIPAMVSEPNQRYLLPDRGEVTLRDRLDPLAQHPEERRRVGEANRLRVAALFDAEAMVEAHARLYGQAMGRPGVLG